MKKFYMILAALLIGSVCFAQFAPRQAYKAGIQSTAADRSGYVGNLSFDQVIYPMSNGNEFAIAPKQYNSSLSGNITKVKFYHHTQGAYTNTSYTIKIYNNISLGGDYAGYGLYDETSCGTAAYTQNYTATENGWQEVELTTPYTIPSGEFWVSIQVNGNGLLCLGGAASAVEGQYYMKSPVQVSETQSVTFWSAPSLTQQGSSQETLYSCCLAVFVDDGAAEEIHSDFQAKLLNLIIEGQNASIAPAPDQYTIGTTDDLVIYPFYQNNGPSVATSGTLTATIKLGGSTYGTPMTRTFTAEAPCAISSMPESFYQAEGYAVTITAAEMDAMGVGNNFEVCYEVSYTGGEGTDDVSANNSFCIPVTRTNAVCDIQAKLYTDAQGTAEVGATLTLAADQDFVVYPAIFNAGPDAAAGTVTLDVQMDGASLVGGAQSMSLASQPIAANDFITIMQNGALTISAALLDQYQITGTFEVCLIANYSGNDPNTENNTKCVTVTRQTVAVEENIAEAVSVYPNPANDMFTVANAEGATIVVVNSLGQVVTSIENAASNQTIDASNFANGTYFVKVNENVIKINVVK